MNSVRAAPIPIRVREKGHEPEQRSHDVIGSARREERGVAAVVLRDEEADEQEAGRLGRDIATRPARWFLPTSQPRFRVVSALTGKWSAG